MPLVITNLLVTTCNQSENTYMSVSVNLVYQSKIGVVGQTICTCTLSAAH